jgi:hypothetical protein
MGSKIALSLRFPPARRVPLLMRLCIIVMPAEMEEEKLHIAFQTLLPCRITTKFNE